MARGKRGPEKGSLVDETAMHQAARVWIELEDAGKLSHSEIGRRVGLKRAPEWLNTDRFRQILEMERFDVELSAVRGLKGASSIVDQILSLGFAEMFKRLKTSPADVPYPVLFGDLTRLLKMRAELDAQEKGKPLSPASLFITIRQELLQVPNPALQQAVLTQIFGDYQRALSTVKDLLPAGASHDVVDVVGVPVGVPGPDRTLALPAGPVERGGDRVWSDPVEQIDA